MSWWHSSARIDVKRDEAVDGREVDRMVEILVSNITKQILT